MLRLHSYKLQKTLTMELVKDTGGRPVKVLTEDQVKEVEKLARVIPKYMLADYFGMTEKTFRAVEERQPEIMAAYNKGKALAIYDVAQCLVRQAENGNVQAAKFYLKTQGGPAWSENKPMVEIKPPEDVQVTIEVIGADD